MKRPSVNWQFNLKSSRIEGGSSFSQCPRVISVCSGKGGVGKTNVVANLAFAFTQLQKKVLVLDADLGLANINVLLGLNPRYALESFLEGKEGLLDIMIKGPGGMSILPASSGVSELVALNDNQKVFLLTEMDLLAEPVDILLIDTGPGISSNVLYFNGAAQESIVLVTPEPTSLIDAYALIKVLSTRYQKKNFLILINQVCDAQEAKEVFNQISNASDCFLGNLSIEYLGLIPFDPKLPSAVKEQRLVLELDPQAPSSRSFLAVAKILAENPPQRVLNGNIQFFWKKSPRQSTLRKGGVD